jgi:hypothetical protein
MTKRKTKLKTVAARRPSRPAKMNHGAGRPRREDQAANDHRPSKRAARTHTVSGADAPIEAWRQAMVPELEEVAETLGARSAIKRAIVFMILLQFKPGMEIEAFKVWARQVTGYKKAEIAAFAARGAKNFLIVDGRPNVAAFEQDLACGSEDVALTLLASVFVGRLCRNNNGLYSLPRGTT